jgi:hypothetical protein
MRGAGLFGAGFRRGVGVRYRPVADIRLAVRILRGHRSFVAKVSRDKAELFIEAMRLAAVLVRCQLDQAAMPGPTLLQCPLESAVPKSGTSPVSSDTDGLDLASPGPHSRKSWNERKLEGPDDLVVLRHHRQELVGVRLNGVERFDIGTIDRHRRVFS